MTPKKKREVGVQVTGRSVAYIQEYGRGGKPGKPKPVIITTVRPKISTVAPKKKRRR